jgi:acetyl-CoA synthetase
LVTGSRNNLPLTGFGGGAMTNLPIASNQYNIGFLCTGAHCLNGRGDHIAMLWIDAQNRRREYSFFDIERESNRYANILESLGFVPGDVVFTFLPKMPDQFFAFLGALKARIICGTLFSNFNEEALLDRLGDSNAKGVITKKSFLKKFARIRERLPSLRHMMLVDSDREDDLGGTVGIPALLEGASSEYVVPETSADTPSVLHYTSGSTGKPKGVLHRHGSVDSQAATTRDVISLKQDDVFWCTADQGWITGTSYGIIGPWCLGITQVHYGGGYDAREWMNLIERERVTVWYSAPTALRMLLREDESIFVNTDLSRLRHIFSVGEPLNPEVIHWGRRVLKHDIFDTWFQTETGAIMISNRPGIEIRPGSMGKPVEAVEAAIIADDGSSLPDLRRGNLCLRPGWASMFIGYYNHEDIYRQKFRNGYYYTGDTAYRDADGYYWFTGRSDDVINTSGHLISPFEVESTLLEIAEIAESGVIGAPDELLFEKVVAFVRLREGFAPSPDLELKIRLYVSNRASSLATPQEIIFCDSIPKNRSGKIMRRVLKARYLGQDPGDISTLEQ